MPFILDWAVVVNLGIIKVFFQSLLGDNIPYKTNQGQKFRNKLQCTAAGILTNMPISDKHGSSIE